MPVTYDWELEPDGQPQRVRVLGEDLLAWRDTDGRPSFSQENCPHRGAGFYFGRNEKGGLRCAYHGWKFDVEGNCLDMPNEPPTSNFRHKVKILAYKAYDFGGIVWIYMGENQDNPPPVPQFEWGLVPEEQRGHGHKFIYECNWMQALEGELDSSHIYFLHSRLNKDDSPKYGLYHPGQTAKFHIVNKEYGMMYGAQREEGGNDYWRVSHYLFPIYGMFPAIFNGIVPLSIFLPIDDDNTLHFGVHWHPTKPLEGFRRPNFALSREPGVLGPPGPMKPRAEGQVLRQLVVGNQPGDGLPHGPLGQEEPELHRHTQRSTAGRRAGVEHGPRHGPHQGAPRHRRCRHHQDPQEAHRRSPAVRRGRHAAPWLAEPGVVHRPLLRDGLAPRRSMGEGAGAVAHRSHCRLPGPLQHRPRRRSSIETDGMKW